jgi:O-antigen/teichoic acid export membrane protein
VGAFVVASAWLRTPTILIGGLSVQALTELARAWGSADRRQLVGVAKPLFTTAGYVAVAATAACMAASPWAFRILYGAPTRLAPVLLVSLAISTVLAIGAVMTGTALLATDNGRFAAIAWSAGASVTMVGTLVGGGHSTLLAAALLLGPGLALALGVAFLRRRLPFGRAIQTAEQR